MWPRRHVMKSEWLSLWLKEQETAKTMREQDTMASPCDNGIHKEQTKK